MDKDKRKPTDREWNDTFVAGMHKRAAKSIDELVAASSLGTPGAVAVRHESGLDKDLSALERAALQEVKNDERARIVKAVTARADKLFAWMREQPVDSEKRRELSIRGGEVAEVARAIASGEIFLP